MLVARLVQVYVTHCTTLVSHHSHKSGHVCLGSLVAENHSMTYSTQHPNVGKFAVLFSKIRN